MAPKNPLTLQTQGFGIERSNSTLRADLWRLVGYPGKPNKPACSTSPPSNMQSSLSSTRSFLSKTGKMRSFRRKNTSGESATLMQLSTAAPPQAALKEEKQRNELPATTDHLDVVLRDCSTPSSRSEITEEVFVASVVDLPAKSSDQFQGLPDYRTDAGSNQDLIDHEFLQQAFGITMEKSATGREHAIAPSVELGGPVTAPECEDETFEMEVPIQFVKDTRPELQVSIPMGTSGCATTASVHLSVEADKLLGTPSTISPPSTCTSARPRKPFNGLATARLSIVSPLSVVEMPKPRRPFSALSLEGMTAGMPQTAPPATKSATSNSSADVSEQDCRSSSFCHSPSSSMSSINSDTGLPKSCGKRGPSVPNSVSAPGEAGALDSGDLAPRRPTNTRSNTSFTSTTIRTLRNQNSTTSLRSVVSVANRNKPLPPEPGEANVRPLKTSGPSPSRSSSMTMRQRGTPAQNYSGDSPTSALNLSRRPSKASTLLKSKYTPKDLDALDDAFQRNVPSYSQGSFSYSNNSTPTLSQVTLALENQLDTIKEDSPRTSAALTAVGNPLQISRGPMRMEPSRRAPPPPPRIGSPTQDRQETRRRMMKRSASSNHVITQMRSGSVESFGRRRASTAGSGSISKANRILGRTGPTTPPRMERQGSLESIWSATESPQNYTTSTSPAMSGEESPAPESEQSTIPDAHFEEVRKRLELLSPKDDPSLTFLAFHQRNASRSSEKLLLLKQNSFAIAKDVFRVPPSKTNDIYIPEHIAELEGNRIPSPAELEDTQRPLPVELAAAPSPQPPPLPSPIKEDNVHPLERRGRKDELSPLSSTTASVAARSLHSARSVKCRSLASLAMSEIPDLYASIPTTESKLRPSMTPEEVEQLISADAAERVLLRILQSLENLKDLFAAAEVSRGFYRTFKRHELSLIKNALWCMSPAAWELREVSIPFHEMDSGALDYKPSLYLRHYTRDLLTMVELKSMILDHCKSFLRVETISGLAGETDRSPFIDDAFWRVWTFCRVFGCGRGREDDIVGQMDWLRGGILAKQQSTNTNTLAFNDSISMNSVLFNPPAGFAKGNGQGLTAEELYDMTEIWTCLGVLVRGYQGKRDQAREHGIFAGANIAPGDIERENAAIEEWTYHLLTLAPASVLEVTAPTSPTQETFANARSQGYTIWTPPTHGSSRSTFLKEAVSRVYEEKMSLRRQPLSEARSFSTLPQVASPPESTPGSPDAAFVARQRCAVHRAEIRAKRQDPAYKDTPVSEERPMSNYPDVLARLDALSTSATKAPPMPKLPSLATRLSFRKPKAIASSPSKSKMKISPLVSAVSSPTASPLRKRGGRPNESQESLPTSEYSFDKVPILPNSPSVVVPSGPQVRDPVDVAVEKLTAMGFEESRAKKALAETDSGNSVNFERAVSMLVKEREKKRVMHRLDRMG
ncbi:hypothetical protein MMC13_007196 [Lambiella insularis]|nr:hypothetical protein [Lambiella insularis]